MSWGFNNFSRTPIAAADELVGKVTLDWGLEPEVRAVVPDTITAILSPDQERSLVRQLDLPKQLPAPIAEGAELGRLKISLGDSLLADVSIVAEKGVGRMGLWEKLMSYF